MGSGTSRGLCVTLMPLLFHIRKFLSLRDNVKKGVTSNFYHCNCTLLQKLSWIYLTKNESNSQETFGALDLGGASTQITFVPENQTIESPENAMYFRLYGKDYSLYTHSFLCYGMDQALLKKLIKDSQASITESRPDFSTSGLPTPTSCCFLFYFSD